MGWSPDVFWAATPAEVAALFGEAGDAADTLTNHDLTQLMEAYPDG